MNIERLFQVLVLGGAALAAPGCGDDPAGTSGSGGAEPGQGGGGSGGSPAGPTSTATTGGGGSGADGGAGGAGGVATSGGGASPLECSAVPDPADACGCPCCWVENCLNTDEACCGGFCNLGNDGAGCCDL
jgi:hypothetical protein